MAAEKLSQRPGWVQLCRAADELHAAELLIGDPLARPRTAVPHLREFWSALVEAGNAAKLGEPASETPDAWLEGELPGLDQRTRAKLIEHWRTLDAGDSSNEQLRAHARAAHALLAKLEPVIGGEALRRRGRRILFACIGTAIVLLPVVIYAALHREVSGEGPWLASYFSDRKLESSPSYVREDDITHDWGKDAPLEAVPPDKFSVRWDTCLRIDEPGPVVFQLNANDGARLLIDGENVLDAWDKSESTGKRGFGSVELPLEAGVHHLRVEYFESLGLASLRLAASFADEVPGPIPRERLAYPGDDFDEDDPCAAVR